MQEVYLIINNKGEIMAVKITKGNRSDISTVLSITQGLEGKLFGDKAYISVHDIKVNKEKNSG